MRRYELHLAGCRGPVLWSPEDGKGAAKDWVTPPRVVIYGEKVWHFYRFREARLPGYLAATYREATVLRLAPGEYEG